MALLLCEKSLYRFVRMAWPVIESAPFIDNWHIGFVCEHLQAVTTGQIPKLLINIPPGCSKSLLTSVLWPAWEWSIDPAIRWFCASYDQRLSTRDSVKCRSILTSEWFRQMWPEKVKFRNDQDQKTYYETLAGGWRLATSIGGHGTGEHPDRIIVDDPHDAKGAESEAERTSVNEWWDLTMSTRGTSRNARRVIIMQRLNEDDLSGHVLGEGDWVHLCLPMRYEPGRMKPTPLGKTDPRTVEGELLTPRQFDEAKVSAMERSMGSYGTSGQFQQRPSPAGGDFFKLPWFKMVEASPAKGHRVRYWDKAGSSGKGDYSAGVLMLMAEDGIFCVEDVVRGQWSAHERNRIMAQTAAMDHDRYGGNVAIWIEQEPGSSGKESAEISVRELAGFDVHAEPVSGQGDKQVRARPFAAQCEAGNVRLVRGAWNKAYLDELMVFPNGKNDDQVDGSSGAFNKLILNQKKELMFW